MPTEKYTSAKYIKLIENAELALESSLDYNERWAIDYWTQVVTELNVSYAKTLN